MDIHHWPGVANGDQVKPVAKRGLRAGVDLPEIVERQARATFGPEGLEAWRAGLVDFDLTNGVLHVSMTTEQAFAWQTAREAAGDAG